MLQDDTRAMAKKALTLIETGHLLQARTLYEQVCLLSPMDAESISQKNLRIRLDTSNDYNHG